MEFRKLCGIVLATVAIVLDGCHKPSSPTQDAATTGSEKPKTTPVKPVIVVAPDFFISHQDQQYAVVIVPQTTTDEGIANLIWLLRDSAYSKSMNSLGFSETIVENRDWLYSFHIFRGKKCADENYRNGREPCASSKQEAGIFQYGSFHDRNDDAATIYHDQDESKAEALSPIGSPYTPKPNIVPSEKTMVVLSNEEKSTWGSVAQRQLAADYTGQVWGGGLHATFATAPKAGELNMSADWLIDQGERKVTAFTVKAHQEEACAVGFRSVRLSSFPSHPDYSFSLGCPSAEGNSRTR